MLARTTLGLTIAWLALASTAWPQATAPKKLAFLVGVEKYQKDGLSDLNYPDNDIEALDKTLAGLGFEREALLREQATLANIRTKFSTFLARTKRELGKDDIVFVALCGHGLQFDVEREVNSEKKLVTEAYFCPYDAFQFERESLLPINEVIQGLSEQSSSAQNLVVIDACRDDPTRGRGVEGSTVRQLPAKLSVLFACSSNQRSFESSKVEHGVFTYLLLEALRGKRANERGEVTWGSLVDYVTSEVPRQLPELVPGLMAAQEPHQVSNSRRNPVLGSVKLVPKPGTPEAVITVKSLDMKLTYNQAGEFQKGANHKENDEKPWHKVKIAKPFYLGVYEVTQGQWTRLMGDEPWVTKPSEDDKQYVRTGRDYPATYVSYDDAIEFCSRVTIRERQANRLSEDEVYRLPTNEEFEFAHRAGSTNGLSFGNYYERLPLYAWYGGIDGDGNTVSEQYAHRVGLKLPNVWGLYDIHGNVWEWCHDLNDGQRRNEAVHRTPASKQAINMFRLKTGGSWAFSPDFCLPGSGIKESPGDGDWDSGFRLVRGPILSK